MKGVNDIFINIFQEDEFDYATALSYEIVDNNDSIILRKSFLIWTLDGESYLKSFTANSYDSIIYLTYPDPMKIYAVFDLKSKRGYPNGIRNNDYEKGEQLFKRLQSFNPNFRAGWNE